MRAETSPSMPKGSSSSSSEGSSPSRNSNSTQWRGLSPDNSRVLMSAPSGEGIGVGVITPASSRSAFIQASSLPMPCLEW